MSRFAAAPREGHLILARKILGYLKKFPKKGIVINPNPPDLNDYPNAPHEVFEDFSHQYKFFKEELDPYFPNPKVRELLITIFCDADHAHDLVTGRSVTGVLAFVGSTPVHWKSSRQTSVQTSTFGSELTAFKTAVEMAVTIRYHLRAMGVKITSPTRIYIDNRSVFLNTSNPASTLNKKTVSLAYHFTRQYRAAKVVDARLIKSEDNYADILTKALNTTLFRNLVNEFMINQQKEVSATGSSRHVSPKSAMNHRFRGEQQI